MVHCGEFKEFRKSIEAVSTVSDITLKYDNDLDVSRINFPADTACDSNNDCSGGYCVNLSVGDYNVPALLDTGATVSVIDVGLLSRIPYLKHNMNRSSISEVSGLGGSKVEILGEITCDFRLGDNLKFLPHTLHVVHASLSIPIILGMDFMRRNKLIIDIANNKVFKQNCDYSLTELLTSVRVSGHSKNIYNINTEYLNPFERKLIPLTLKSNITKEGCISPIGSFNSWLTASSLNIVRRGITWGEVVNLTSEPVTLRKGTKIGLWNSTYYTVNVAEVCNDSNEICRLLKLDDLPVHVGQKRALKNLVTEYRDVFSLENENLGYCDTIKHTIDVGDIPPIRQRFRRLNPPIRDEVNKELLKMERQNIIEKSVSPWCSPLVPVRKRDGKIRICVDYRKLNSVTKMNSYPLPNIEDNLSQFTGARFFSTLDLRSGYHQVALDEESKEKTAFATEGGLYQYRVMPQGACGSPATFQNLMNVVLSGIPSRRALAYLDDILVVGVDFDDHLASLGEVLERLRIHGLKLSVDKCNLLKCEVPYLGHVLSREGIKPSRHNVEALISLPPPRTVRQVKRLCGMVSYYGKFVRNISSIMSPIYSLISSKKKIDWSDECEESFTKVKGILSTYPILSFPRYGPNDEFILTTDASEDGVGAVLSQIQDGEEKCLGYGSSSFSKAQSKYTATEKELAAVRYGVKHFKPYLYGRKFVIRVDHQALVYLEQMKCVDNRLLRTYEDIQIGEYRIEYLKGSQNVVADMLSRTPLNTEIIDDEQEL